MSDETQQIERPSLPTWRYRASKDSEFEKRLFDHPDDVPDGEGWVDSPANIGSAPPAPARLEAEEPEATETEPEPATTSAVNTPKAALRELGWNDLRAEYRRVFGKGVRAGMSRDTVIAELEALQ